MAIDLAQTFANQGCHVLLFAEWRRKDVLEETLRIQGIYEKIRTVAQKKIAGTGTIDVVPVGLVWDKVLIAHPELTLHSDDGNHSNEIGGAVTAIAFYVWLFDEVPLIRPKPIEKDSDFNDICQIALKCTREYKQNLLAEIPK